MVHSRSSTCPTGGRSRHREVVNYPIKRLSGARAASFRIDRYESALGQR
jgi:hypothetical protein